MFKNYIISALRNISRNRFYALLNIIGLSVGMAAFIFILLFVRDEMTFDKQNTDHQRIHRVEMNFNIAGKHDMFAIAPVPMGPALKLEMPEVESFTRLMEAGDVVIKYGDKEYYEDRFFIADSTVFDFFTHTFIAGTAENALNDSKTIVLTEKIAKKYFGDRNPVGEVLVTADNTSLKVTAVIANQSSNVHLKYDALISAATVAEDIGQERFNSMEPGNFWNIGVFTFLKLVPGTDIKSVHEKWPAFYEKYMKPIGDQINASCELMTTPLAESHYRTGLSSDQPTGNMAYIYIFSAVAIFILLIAAINYMNMATAKSANRAREVGMRKVVGAYRGQLIRQFIGESLLLATVALVLAIFIVFLLLPDFNNLSGKTIASNFFTDPFILSLMVIGTLFIGILSGSYPAFFLSSFQPVVVLKGKLSRSGKSSLFLRRILVVIQFFIATSMIIATFVVSDQLHFMRNKDLGFNKENLMILQMQDSAFRSKAYAFRDELNQNPYIKGATITTGVPGNNGWIEVMYIEKEEKMVEAAVILAQVDYNYVDVMGMEIIKGRNFDKSMKTDDSAAVIINETGARMFGWGEDAIGKKINYGVELDGRVPRPMKVIGVVKDFHFNSLHNKIEPIILFISRVPRWMIAVRIDEEHKKEAMAFIEEKWNAFGANRPFNYTFIDENLDEMYQSEKKLSNLFSIAAVLTIFIALLGMLGLSSFIAEQKFKEIGLRKILGASVGSILQLLSKEFMMLIIVAIIIAIPIAYWRLDVWLESAFVYHDKISWAPFVLAGLAAIIVGLVTISFHIIRAATVNPVDAIKYE